MICYIQFAKCTFPIMTRFKSAPKMSTVASYALKRVILTSREHTSKIAKIGGGKKISVIVCKYPKMSANKK